MLLTELISLQVYHSKIKAELVQFTLNMKDQLILVIPHHIELENDLILKQRTNVHGSVTTQSLDWYLLSSLESGQNN